MKIINNTKILELGALALNSDRKRTMFNLHASPDDPLQRMVNVLQPGTYLCPHQHSNPAKREIFVILRGLLLICIFNDKGLVRDHIIIGKESGNYVAEISSSTWHTIIPLAVHTAVFECKDGPYDPETDKIFAPWAPLEGTPDGLLYNKNLLDSLGIIFPELM
jgi:cupin fold WbuC family metalloprotein